MPHGAITHDDERSLIARAKGRHVDARNELTERRNNERSLIARAQSGDISARNELIERHWPLVVGLVQQHGGGRDRRDDCRQDAVLAAVEAIREFRPGRGSKLCTYLANKVIWSIVRSRACERVKYGAADDDGPDPRDGIAEVDQADELDRMSSAFDGLNPLDRAILDLRHRQGLPASVIARKLGRKPSVIRDLERIALTRLRMLMGAS